MSVPTHYDVRASDAAGARPRPVSEPAPTITSGLGQVKQRWVFERPATTVTTGTWRPGVIPCPLGGGADVTTGERGGVPVSVADAAVLQGFPADYPFRGSGDRERFRQVGNAIPPPLARAVLEALT